MQDLNRILGEGSDGHARARSLAGGNVDMRDFEEKVGVFWRVWVYRAAGDSCIMIL